MNDPPPSSPLVPALIGMGLGGAVAYLLLSSRTPSGSPPVNGGVARPMTPQARDPVPAEPAPISVDGRGDLPPTPDADPAGGFSVALAVGPNGGKPRGEVRFSTDVQARVYFDAVLPVMRAKYASQGGALILVASPGRMEEWPPAAAVPSPPAPAPSAPKASPVQVPPSAPAPAKGPVQEMPLIRKGLPGKEMSNVDAVVDGWAKSGHTPSEAELNVVVASIAAIMGKQFTPAQAAAVKANVLKKATNAGGVSVLKAFQG